MSLWIMLLGCIGLNLDDFILMMGKGATLKDLTAEKTAAYAGIFGLANALAALIGYMISGLFESMLMLRINATLCALIFLLLGLLFVHKTLTRRNIEEKLDLNFNYKICAKMAVFANITTVFFGAGNGLVSSSLWMLLLFAFVTCFVTVTAALRIGYSHGYRYARVIQGIGGAVLLLMALNIWMKFLG